MKPLRCLAADDERLALRLLKRHIERLPQLELVATYEDAIGVMQHLGQDPEIDLLLLDVHMPNLTGMELLRSLVKPPLAIMITAYPDHALEGFALDVVDYMVKPVSFERFVQAINKVASRLSPAPVSAPPKDHFFVRVDYKLQKLYYQEIQYIEGLAQYVKVHTAQKTYVVHKTLKAMEALLPPQQFYRVHRSYIVSLEKISTVYGNTIVLDQKEVPIGKSYRDAFYQLITD